MQVNTLQKHNLKLINLRKRKLFIFKLRKVAFHIQILTQSAHDVSGTSPEGLLKVLTSGTYRGSSGDPQGNNSKTDNLMRKLHFRSNSPFIT